MKLGLWAYKGNTISQKVSAPNFFNDYFSQKKN